MAKIKTTMIAIREIDIPSPDEGDADRAPRHREMIDVVMDPWRFINDKRTEVTVTTEEIYDNTEQNRIERTQVIKR